MKSTKTKATLAAVVTMALMGGSYAGFSATSISPQQDITSGFASITFRDNMTRASWATEYKNLTAGDTLMTGVDLVNNGTTKLDNFNVQATTTGSDDLKGLDAEGLDITIERVSEPGPDGEYGTADDYVMGPALTQRKLGTIVGNPAEFTEPLMEAGQTTHLRITARLPQGAVKQNQSIGVNYVLGATSTATNYTQPGSKFISVSQNSVVNGVIPTAVDSGESVTWTFRVSNISTTKWQSVRIEGPGQVGAPAGATDPAGVATITATYAPADAELTGDPLKKGYTVVATNVGGREISLPFEAVVGTVPNYPDRPYRQKRATFSEMDTMPDLMSYHPALMTADQKMWIVGGRGGNTLGEFSKAVLQYDVATNRWTRLADMPEGRNKHQAVLDSQENIWYAGGAPFFNGYDNAFWKYSTKTGEFTRKTGMPKPLSFMAVAIDSSDRVYTFGGFNATDYTRTNETYRYDPNTDAWTKLANMPGLAQRSDTAAIRDNLGNIYVMGGLAAASGQSLVASRDNYKYNPSSNTWQTMAPMPFARSSHKLIKDSMGFIYVIGGDTGNTNPRDTEDIHRYEPTKNTWITSGKLDKKYRNFALAADKWGSIYLSGGDASDWTPETGWVDYGNRLTRWVPPFIQ